MTIAGAPLASAPEQNSAYARHKEGRFGKPGRPSLFPLPSSRAKSRDLKLLVPKRRASRRTPYICHLSHQTFPLEGAATCVPAVRAEVAALSLTAIRR
jgi:hypothetical protein